MSQANSPCLDDSIEVRLPIALGPIACRLQAGAMAEQFVGIARFEASGRR
jgi:hypothetical protein